MQVHFFVNAIALPLLIGVISAHLIEANRVSLSG